VARVVGAARVDAERARAVMGRENFIMKRRRRRRTCVW
jgi:hypothetical protein